MQGFSRTYEICGCHLGFDLHFSLPFGPQITKPFCRCFFVSFNVELEKCLLLKQFEEESCDWLVSSSSRFGKVKTLIDVPW